MSRFASSLAVSLALALGTLASCSSTTGGQAEVDATGGGAGLGGQGGSGDTGGRTGTGSSNGTGGSVDGSLDIDTAPDLSAQLNIAYGVTLAASGGNAGDGYVWELVDGELPPGVSLSSGGRLSGSPRMLGSFEFTVQVTDDAGSVAERTFTLEVRQRDWLVYRADKTTPGLSRLYAVQLSTSLLPVTEIAGGPLPDEAKVDAFQFSPDGKKVAFLARLDEGAATVDLYVVDMSTKTPGMPELISLGLAGDVANTFDWSPDSRRIVVAPAFGDGIRAVDVSADPPSVTEIDEGRDAHWISDTVFVNLKETEDHSFSFVRVTWPEDGEPGNAQELTLGGGCFGGTCGQYIVSRPDLGVFEMGTTQVGYVNSHQVLFNNRETAWSTNQGEPPFINPLSPNYERGIVYDSATFELSVQPVPGPGSGKSLAEVGGVVRWSPSSRYLLVSGTDDRFNVVDAEAKTLRKQAIDGEYGAPDIGCKHDFSPNDGWVAIYDQAGALHMSALEDGAPGESQQVSTAFPTPGTDQIRRGIFSPDSRRYAFVGAQSEAGVRDIYLTDLTTGEASPWVRLNSRQGSDWQTGWQVIAGDVGTCDARIQPPDFRFSPNSSHLVYRVERGDYGYGLYVVDLIDPRTGELRAAPQGIERSGSLCSVHGCTGVHEDYAFQP